MPRHFLVLLAWSVAASMALGDIIPADRRVTWTPGVNVGVPGGIPNRTTIYQTLSPDVSTAKIQAALDSCPSGQVVFLNAGTYNITATIKLKSGVTLRGAGNNA